MKKRFMDAIDNPEPSRDLAIWVTAVLIGTIIGFLGGWLSCGL